MFGLLFFVGAASGVFLLYNWRRQEDSIAAVFLFTAIGLWVLTLIFLGIFPHAGYSRGHAPFYSAVSAVMVALCGALIIATRNFISRP